MLINSETEDTYRLQNVDQFRKIRTIYKNVDQFRKILTFYKMLINSEWRLQSTTELNGQNKLTI